PRRRSAVFIVCDRVESYLSYLRQRRPELFGQPAAPDTIATVTDAEVAAARSMPVVAARIWIEQANALVIDLRSAFAYAVAHIAGSVNIVEELFDDLLRGGLPVDAARPVLLACPVGEASLRYAALLTRLGHPDARSLDGGIVAWRDADAPLVRP
ncbi:MAG: rhodanese-like domain-containing protein, partial [Micromonosporaceae bacterium]|nr:rhodanese-like domain-containing protein [Micromonosporaceae bacterium]